MQNVHLLLSVYIAKNNHMYATEKLSGKSIYDFDKDYVFANEDKIIKNHFASEYIYNKHKNAKTVGIISQDKTNGTKIVAEPLGVIAGIVPTSGNV